MIILGCRKSHDATDGVSSFLEILKSFAFMLLLCHLTADSSSFILKKINDLVEVWRFYKLKMKNQTVHFRHILLFYFRKGKNARQACEKLRKVYSDNALQERQCQRWFTKFRAGNFDFNDASRSERPTETTKDCGNIEHPSLKHSRSPEKAEISKQV